MKTPKGWTKVSSSRGGNRHAVTPTVSLTKTSISFLGFDRELSTFTIFRRGIRCRVYFEEASGHYKLSKSNAKPRALPLFKDLDITVTKTNRIPLIRARCKGDAWEFDLEGIE